MNPDQLIQPPRTSVRHPRRTFATRVLLACLAIYALMHCAEARAQDDSRPPNFVVIFADDLGYGDLGCFGHPTIRTPHLDRMAREGMKLTQFYVAASVCTPSRAGLITGRYPIRSGMCSTKRRVLFADSPGGLPQEEITIAEALKAAGYATACVGKWHLGHKPEHLPTQHGFDSYFGIPYSNDMRLDPESQLADDAVLRDGYDPANAPREGLQNGKVPLMRNDKVIEYPVDQNTLIQRYDEEAVRFIEANRDRPFFLYYPHTFPHIPLYASDDFRDASSRGLYGDVVEEIDASVGKILDTLRRLDLEENTLVIFTSDNGPWAIQKLRGGSAGLLREAKGCTWEGGMRVPTIAWQPGTVPAGTTNQALSSTLDLFATFVHQADAKLPNDREMDSHDLTEVLRGSEESPRESLIYYRGTRVFAIRKGPWKAHLVTQQPYGGPGPMEHNPPLLFQLEHDPSELYPVEKNHPDVVADLMAELERHQATVKEVPSQLER
jgi:arylsulfatase A-like enzyme